MSRRKTLNRENTLRALIWKRDGGHCRASGQWLDKHADDWHHRGECAHILSRSTHPEKKYDPSNVILISARNHWLSDARGGKRLKIIGEDANGPITFRMTDKDGHVLWERTSSPP